MRSRFSKQVLFALPVIHSGLQRDSISGYVRVPTESYAVSYAAVSELFVASELFVELNGTRAPTVVPLPG